MPIEIADLNERLAEAARYALMRRLMPAIRHHLAGSLQPIGMLSAMLERRVKAAVPDIDEVAKNMQALNTLAREAAATSLNLMAWLAPKDNGLVAVNSAIEEAFGMIATELSFRGFSLANEAAGTSAKLPMGVLRSVFTASLITLTDAATDAASVVVSCSQEAGQTRLEISLVQDAEAGPAMVQCHMPGYRALQWADVEALATAEGVQLQRAAGRVQLVFGHSSPGTA